MPEVRVTPEVGGRYDAWIGDTWVGTIYGIPDQRWVFEAAHRMHLHAWLLRALADKLDEMSQGSSIAAA